MCLWQHLTNDWNIFLQIPSISWTFAAMIKSFTWMKFSSESTGVSQIRHWNFQMGQQHTNHLPDEVTHVLMLVEAHLNSYLIVMSIKILFSFPSNSLVFAKIFHWWPHIVIAKMRLYKYFTFFYSLVDEFGDTLYIQQWCSQEVVKEGFWIIINKLFVIL